MLCVERLRILNGSCEGAFRARLRWPASETRGMSVRHRDASTRCDAASFRRGGPLGMRADGRCFVAAGHAVMVKGMVRALRARPRPARLARPRQIFFTTRKPVQFRSSVEWSGPTRSQGSRLHGRSLVVGCSVASCSRARVIRSSASDEVANCASPGHAIDQPTLRARGTRADNR